MKRQALSIAALMLFAPAAHAADLSWNSGTSPLYSPSPASGWDGFYAGLNAGHGWGTGARQNVAGGATTERNTGGWQLGGQAGYNMDMGGFVLGAEGDLQFASIGYEEDLGATGKFKSGVDFYGTVRGRAGMSFGTVLPYVTGGIAAGRGSASLTDPANVVTSQSATHVGWTLGVGLEAQATDKITVKAEYLYVDLGTQTYNGLPIGNQDITQRFGVVRAGVNYKF
ncbi:porin family protein [Devosia sp. J2-20]|uniref:outer membrane protein n=1 Tax=Devosia sp. J2-20 TaxID=3026161 RepID=UPI00249CBDD8|nr:outer membrane protein [Devosia sp. J2-20]WDQ99851.1 porin family protein [Devosia sp. J2-20]